jgi:Rieske Fe-S protein
MPDMSSTPEPDLTRRSMMRGLAVGGLALPLLAACGAGSTSAGTSGGGSAKGPAGSDQHSGKRGKGGGGHVLASTADVPVGGGTILSGQQVVLTQPSKGEYKGFSAICTHQGCPVNQISNGTIDCPCHGSQFSIKDGSVVGGPAPSPLPEVKITVQGSKIRRA